MLPFYIDENVPFFFIGPLELLLCSLGWKNRANGLLSVHVLGNDHAMLLAKY